MAASGQEILNFVAQLIAFILLLDLLQVVIDSQRLNGETHRAFRYVVYSVTLLIIWTGAGRLDTITDFAPSVPLYLLCVRWIWVPYVCITVSLWNLRRAMRKGGKR